MLIEEVFQELELQLSVFSIKKTCNLLSPFSNLHFRRDFFNLFVILKLSNNINYYLSIKNDWAIGHVNCICPVLSL